MSFIHFGCWNYGLCNIDQNQNGVSKVMSELKKYDKKVNFVIVAGDNYYDFEGKREKKEKKKDKSEEKKDKSEEKKIKKFNKDNFESGVTCLNDALKNTKKYILLGNHEFDQLEEIEEDKEVCNLMRLQKKTFDGSGYEFFEKVITNELENTLIIMIDSTLYEMSEKKDANLYCPNVFPKIERDYSKLIEEQEKQIKDELIKNKKENVVIVGHHPIITLKKNDKGKLKNEILFGLKNLFENISTSLNGKKVYYLCADNHLRQEGELEIKGIKIKQYVSGTGGADLDYCREDIENQLNYRIEICNGTYGFYLIEEKGKDLKFNFIDVGVPEEELKIRFDNEEKWKNEEKLKQKYLKYKQKYLQLKKSIYN